MKRALLLLAVPWFAQAVENTLHRFERVQLTDRYYSEGVNAADINGDGRMDVIHGPFWFAGPDFKTQKVIYQTAPQNREAYANNFFSWPHDFNGDGHVDVLTAGFPGTPAHLYENPGPQGHDQPWPKHEVFDWVSNESPHFTNLVGDDKPELVCTRDGFFGYAEVDWSALSGRWTFRAISERIAPERFGHGLGVGDVNGDGRPDVLMKDGWFEQPADPASAKTWTLHKVTFAQKGGAEMFTCDVDGDGDSDVITSLAAHEYGLAWHEQTPQGFREHLIMGDRPALNRYGVFFSELHSVQLADMDGDGLQDIITGKTYWSHHRKSHGWDDGAVVYWFKLVRGKDGVDWVPFKADGESGIGRQIVIKDVNGDRLPDILTGGMKGAHVLLHRTRTATADEWRAAQPQPLKIVEVPQVAGKPAPIDEATGRVPDAMEGEALAPTAKVTHGTAKTQGMKNFTGTRWSSDAQLFWSGGGVGDRLEISLTVPAAGAYTLETVFTRAPDFAVVQLALDGKDLGQPLDLYQFGKVTTTGVLEHRLGPLTAGAHALVIRITGTNPNAEQSRFVGLDYLRLVKSE